MDKLTKKIAIDAVKHIVNVAGDDEQAHSEEDSLRDWFINCVADNMYTKNEMVEIAEIIKQTESIEFARWCA